MNPFWEKFKEVMLSVLPITVIVLLIHFFVAPLPALVVDRFLMGAALVVVGLTLFLVGVDLGVTPLGEHIGTSISKPNRVWIIVAVGLLVGFFVSIAEPDLQILAAQVEAVTAGEIGKIPILVVVSVGIAALMVLGLLRIVYNFSLSLTLLIGYGIMLVLGPMVPPSFLAISFDASGATTGALTVPFIMALAVGVSNMKKNSVASEEDSFGLLGVTSMGAILGVLGMGLVSKIGELKGVLPASEQSEGLIGAFLAIFPVIAMESVVAVAPLLVILALLQVISLQLTWKKLRRLIAGLIYTLVGLTVFLVGVNAGFMGLGAELGQRLAHTGNIALPIMVGFVLGLVTILAEPAVHVLTRQIEDVTAGYVRRPVVLGALSLGVGCAVALSIVRILVPGIQLWHYLLPGFGLSVLMSFFVPKLFVGIAFDSGGVASGPMCATFVLAFAQGVAEAVPGADVLKDAFGMIALVAMTPIITLQTLGLLVRLKARRKRRIKVHERV